MTRRRVKQWPRGTSPLLWTVGCTIAFWSGGCDWDYYALLNSIPGPPIHGDNPPIHVFLGVDSLAERTVREAVAQGAFSEPSWHFARVATAFPGTSDIAWTRIMQTRVLDGYEYQYYDPASDQMIRAGYWGLFTHAVPWLEKPCYRAFDYSGDGVAGIYYMYRDPWFSLQNAMDISFVTLAQRAQDGTAEVYAAYFNELDAMAHMLPSQDTGEALMILDQTIRDFKDRHRERVFLFTLVSDHGQNFLRCADESCLIRFQRKMPELGMRTVEHLSELGPNDVGAIPVIHTRVNYLALQTRPDLAPEVARRSSTADYVDLALAKLPVPETTLPLADLAWYGAWRGGALVVRFGYEPSSDTYLLDGDSDWSALGLEHVLPAGAWQPFADEALFSITGATAYPDFFFRVRTALEPVGVRTPASVLLSFKHPFASLGFEVPGDATAIAAESFHGALTALDTYGVLVTEEGPMPPLVRADNVLDLMPVYREHLQTHGHYVGPLDAKQSLDYAQISTPAW